MDTQELPDQTQKRLLSLQQRIQDIIRTVLEARGLSPAKYAVDYENGYIIPIEQNTSSLERPPSDENAK